MAALRDSLWNLALQPLITHVTNREYCISTTAMPTATKFGRVLTHHKGLPLINTDEIMWRPKNIISPLTECLWPPNLAGWWPNLIRFYTLTCYILIIYSTLWSSDLTRSPDNLNHIFTTTVPMASKLDRIVTYHERLLLIKSHVA